MARESNFINAVNGPLPGDIHHQSMTMAATVTPGTPDRYYDWRRDLWVEFKVVNGTLGRSLKKGDLPTELQLKWLNRRHAAGGNACVMVGLMVGNRWRGIVLETPEAWTTLHSREFVIANLKPAAELAHYILQRVN